MVSSLAFQDGKSGPAHLPSFRSGCFFSPALLFLILEQAVFSSHVTPSSSIRLAPSSIVWMMLLRGAIPFPFLPTEPVPVLALPRTLCSSFLGLTTVCSLYT